MKIIKALVSGSALLLALTPAPAHAAPTQVSLPLGDAITALPLAPESRDGYNRNAFKHWIDGDGDGCHARAEVLLRDAAVAPTRSGRCTLTGGRWVSWYDGAAVEGPRGVDIDHMVPLAEAWDSGASGWPAERRERYANDLGDRRALQAVSARSNRSKADRDPADWMPPAAGAGCRYVAEWVAVKHRWGLAVDDRELGALREHGQGCDETVAVEIAD